MISGGIGKERAFREGDRGQRALGIGTLGQRSDAGVKRIEHGGPSQCSGLLRGCGAGVHAGRLSRSLDALTLRAPAFYIGAVRLTRAPMAELVDASELKIGFRKECWFDSG